jgi:hypothetical protein
VIEAVFRRTGIDLQIQESAVSNFPLDFLHKKKSLDYLGSF